MCATVCALYRRTVWREWKRFARRERRGSQLGPRLWARPPGAGPCHPAWRSNPRHNRRTSASDRCPRPHSAARPTRCIAAVRLDRWACRSYWRDFPNFDAQRGNSVGKILRVSWSWARGTFSKVLVNCEMFGGWMWRKFLLKFTLSSKEMLHSNAIILTVMKADFLHYQCTKITILLFFKF